MDADRVIRPVSRRDLLRWSAVLAGASALSGCSFFDTEPQQNGGGSPAAGAGKEAPSLAELVSSGQLPPVEERLPDQPVVVQPVDEPGSYGGTWRTALTGPADIFWLTKTMGYEPLLRWDPVAGEIVGNVAESFEVSEDNRTFTFRLRPGLKWSDGQPFTADDVAFAYNEVLLDPELTTSPPPAWLCAGGRPDGAPATVEKVDDFTVAVTFEEPSGLLPMYLANSGDQLTFLRPAHYLRQFHRAHADVDALVASEGATDYPSLFWSKASSSLGDIVHWQNVELPRLSPWIPTAPLAESGEYVVERNPYYWKVDTNGSQLPYIDAVRYTLVQDTQAVLQMALNGELDLHQRHITTAQNKPVVAENGERGGYSVYSTVDTICNHSLLIFNQGTPDPVKRELFRSADFRIGLSYALNREEIIQTVFAGQAEPWQGAPLRESGFYHERLATQYTEYDLDAANEHLDRAGLAQRDAQGRRLGPDGNPVTFLLNYALGVQDEFAVVADLARAYWAEVGVTAVVKGVENAYMEELKKSGQHELIIQTGQGGGPEAVVNPVCYVPHQPTGGSFAPMWGTWFSSGGAEGEEPPAQVQEQLQLLTTIRATVDPDERARLMQRLLDIAADQFYVIGVALLNPGSFWGVASNAMHNLRDAKETVLASGQYPSPGTTFPEQLYLSS